MVGRYVVHTSFPNIESCVNKITVTVLYIIGPVLISMLSEGDFHERFAEGGRVAPGRAAAIGRQGGGAGGAAPHGW